MKIFRLAVTAAALLLAASILFYVMIYTVWLKRRTAQNIVIGGAADLFPGAGVVTTAASNPSRRARR